MESISVRNDIYAIERKMTDNKGVSDLLKEIRIVNFTGAYGFLESDIERFEKTDGGYAVMQGGLKIEVSHRRKEDLLAFFDQL